MNAVSRSVSSAVLSLLVLLQTGLAAPAFTVKDGHGRDITIKDPSRIVSIGGAVTEILYALGKADRIVGVDASSLYPVEALKTKPNVGYFRQLSPEGVLGLGPSLILAAEGSGPKEAVSVLEAASVPFVRVPDTYDAKGILDKIRIVAAASDSTRAGECLTKLVESDLAALAQMRKSIKKPARVMFILSFVGDKPMVAGRGTAADGLIKLAGGVNVFNDFEGYKPVNEEAVLAASPDWVIATQRGNHALDPDAVFAKAAFSTTPAAQRKQFFSMEGLYMLGFGPRTARAARDLSRTLYPDLKAEALPSDQNATLACHQ
jgi:iron complex transport system substrate-binding protein